MGAKKRKSIAPKQGAQEASDNIWNEFYAQLIEYGLEHDTYQVPPDYEVKTEDGRVLRLGLWLRTQGEKLMEYATKYPHWYNDIADLMETGKLWFDNPQPTVRASSSSSASPLINAAPVAPPVKDSPYKLVDTGRKAVKDLFKSGVRRPSLSSPATTSSDDDIPAKRLRSAVPPPGNGAAAAAAGANKQPVAPAAASSGARARTGGSLSSKTTSASASASSKWQTVLSSSPSASEDDSGGEYFPSIARGSNPFASRQRAAASGTTPAEKKSAKQATPIPQGSNRGKGTASAAATAGKATERTGKRGRPRTKSPAPQAVSEKSRQSPIVLAAAARLRGATAGKARVALSSEEEWSEAETESSVEDHSDVPVGKRGGRGRHSADSGGGKATPTPAAPATTRRQRALSISSEEGSLGYPASGAGRGGKEEKGAGRKSVPASSSSSSKGPVTTSTAAKGAPSKAVSTTVGTSTTPAPRNKRSLEDVVSSLTAQSQAAQLYSVDGPELMPIARKDAPPPKGIARPEQQPSPGVLLPPRRTMWKPRPVPPTPPSATDLATPLPSASLPPQETAAASDTPLPPEPAKSSAAVPPENREPVVAGTAEPATTAPLQQQSRSSVPPPPPPPPPRRRIREDKLAAAAASPSGMAGWCGDESKDSPRVETASSSSSVGGGASRGLRDSGAGGSGSSVGVDVMEPDDETDLVVVTGRQGHRLRAADPVTPLPPRNGGDEARPVMVQGAGLGASSPVLSPAQPKYVSPGPVAEAVPAVPPLPPLELVRGETAQEDFTSAIVTQSSSTSGDRDATPRSGGDEVRNSEAGGGAGMAGTGEDVSPEGSTSAVGGRHSDGPPVPTQSDTGELEPDAEGDESDAVEEEDEDEPPPEFIAFAYIRGAEARRPMLGIGMVCNTVQSENQTAHLFLLVMAPQSRDLVTADYMMDDREAVTVTGNMVLARGLGFEHGHRGGVLDAPSQEKIRAILLKYKGLQPDRNIS